MDRRAFLCGLMVAGIGTSLAVEAQTTRVPRIGYLVLSPLVDPPSAERQAFLNGLSDLGYIEGKSIVIQYRSANWNRGLLPDLAMELVNLRVDVIVAVPGAIEAARDATETIPIVGASLTDPVENKLVASLAHPGGNITGPASVSAELSGKQLQLIKEVIPKLSRVAVLWNSEVGAGPRQWAQTQAAAKVLGVTLQSHAVKDPADLPPTLSVMMRSHPGALLVLASPLTTAYRPIIVEFATKQRLPTIFSLKADAEGGGLISYAASLPDTFRRAARYVDRILKGAKPADLPIEQPTKYELVINLKTAKAIGLTIPQALLVRADQVIE